MFFNVISIKLDDIDPRMRWGMTVLVTFSDVE